MADEQVDAQRVDACFDGVTVAGDLQASDALAVGKHLACSGDCHDALRAAQLLHFASTKSLAEAEQAMTSLQANFGPHSSESQKFDFDIMWDTLDLALEQRDSKAAGQIALWYQTGITSCLPQSDRLCGLWLHRASSLGNEASRIFLGIHCLAGRAMAEGLPFTVSEAMQYLRDTVRKGLLTPTELQQPLADMVLARGAAALGMAYERGYGVQHDLLRSQAYHHVAAQRGITSSRDHVERLQGELASGNMLHAAEVLAEAMDAQDAAALHKAASFYCTRSANLQDSSEAAAESTGSGKQPQDSEFALYLLTQAAQRGHPDALFRWGFTLHKGSFGTHTVQQDLPQAYKLMAQAATLGHTLAARACAEMAEQGRGVPPDQAESDKWLRMAAAGGASPFASAKVAVQALRKAAKAEKKAQTSHSGDEASYVQTPDVDSALEAVRKAAEQDNSGAACNELVKYFDRVAPHYEPPLQPRGGARQAGQNAVRYLSLAAKLGNDASAAVAARRLLKGEGVPKDGNAAEQVLLGAAANGDEACLKALFVAYGHQFYGPEIPASSDKLLSLAQRAFDCGNSDVLLQIAEAFNYSTSHIAEDEGRALKVFDLALQLGRFEAADAMFPLLLNGGQGREPDHPAAMDALRRGTAAGSTTCGEWLAEVLWSELCGESDPDTALDMWHAQAVGGNMLSAARLFVTRQEIDRGENVRSDTTTSDELQSRADAGDVQAAWALCKRLFRGHAGSDSDFARAVPLLRRVQSLGGVPEVHAVLASMASDVLEVEGGGTDDDEEDNGKDDDSVDGKALREYELCRSLLHKGVAEGCALAEYLLGEQCALPTNVSIQHVQDLDAAKQHWQAAAEGGVHFAQARMHAAP